MQAIYMKLVSVAVAMNSPIAIGAIIILDKTMHAFGICLGH